MSGSHPHTLLDDLQCRLHDVLGESASPETVLFTTSFSKEDQILTWAIVEARLDVDMVSLDTGCLFPATQQTWTETEAHFGRSIRRLVPNSATVDAFEAEGGMQSIYLSDVERKRCCGMRKLAPLKEAAAGKDWWITGLRGGHSENRSAMDMVEQAPEWGLRKFHPVLDWEEAMVDAALAATGVPVNPLYAMGYPSIGCAPCTRPVLPGESNRAGRWWWESSSRECGLHRG
jgi:phosphoadenosine phosphosulfate reductase